MGLMMSTFHQKRIGKAAAVVMLFILPFSFRAAQHPQEGGQSTIDPAMVISFMKEKNAAVIDTMSYLECMDHRIPGSHCIALEEVDMKLSSSFPDKSRPVNLLLRIRPVSSGRFGLQKAKLLGHESVYVLEDGLVAWKRAGYK